MFSFTLAAFQLVYSPNLIKKSPSKEVLKRRLKNNLQLSLVHLQSIWLTMASFFGPTMIPNTDDAVKTNLDRRTRNRTPSVMDWSPRSPSLNYWRRSRGSKNPQKSFECPSKGLENSWWNYKKILTCTNSLCAVFQCTFAYNLLNLCPYLEMLVQDCWKHLDKQVKESTNHTRFL